MTIANVQAAATGAAAATGPVAGPGSAAGAPDDVAKAAEGFERLMVAQLSKTLVDSAMPAGDAEGAPDAYRELLPDALTEALMSAGGIGLARALQEALR